METPTLEYFLGSYLHQDWDLMYGTFEGAADAFRSDVPDYVSTILGEIEQVLDAFDDIETGTYINSIDGNLYLEDGRYRAWLANIADRLRDGPS